MKKINGTSEEKSPVQNSVYEDKKISRKGKKKSILKNNYFLYITEFFSGMSVMAVELGASRLLAPYFSSSQIVWTIIIGTIMIAMALGNIYGGHRADKNPDPDLLFGRILIAAVWIAFIPVLGKYMIAGISALLVFTVSTNFLVIAAFVSCMVIFVFPLFLLGTVTPSLVKYSVNSLESSGKVVGYLGASNTVGSIIGTFLPTFVTIPAVGTAVSFLIFSGVLTLLGAVYFLSVRRRPVKTSVAVLLFILCCVAVSFEGDSFAFWETKESRGGDVLYEGESVYNYLQVKENDNETILSTNVLFGVQSVTPKREGLTGMYYDYAMGAYYMIPGGKESIRSAAEFSGKKKSSGTDVLILGMGTGTFARTSSRYFDNLNIQGVEIDSRITDLSHKYFGAGKEAEVSNYDGRAWLQASKKKYDVIMVDAYQDITIPFQMSSKEFFTEVKSHLKAGGVMVVNLNMHGESSNDINAYLCDTVSAVFRNVYTVDVPGYTNRELFAGDRDLNEKFKERTSGTSDEISDPEIQALMDQISSGLTRYHARGHVMTDDNAPVELLGMRMIDKLIKSEVSYYKDIYRKEGLEGILKSF